MSEEIKEVQPELVEQPKTQDPLLAELLSLKEPKLHSGMKQFTKMQSNFINEVVAYTNRQATLMTMLSAKPAITQQLEQMNYIIPRTEEAAKEFIDFITPHLEAAKKQAEEVKIKETQDGQEKVSGTPDSAI